MTEITCENCDRIFETDAAEGEVRCPGCGAYHDVPSKGLESLVDKTELAAPPPADRTVADLPPAEPDRVPPDDEFFDRATQISSSLNPLPKETRHLVWLNTLGPTLIVTVLFLGWIGYDKAIRPDEFETAVTASVRAFREGDLEKAKAEVKRALELKPRSRLAREIRDLVDR